MPDKTLKSKIADMIEAEMEYYDPRTNKLADRILELIRQAVPKNKRKSSHMLLDGKYEEVCSCAFRAYNSYRAEIMEVLE